jgi:predicted DNA-binding protein (UPF0251 family)
MWRRGHRRRRGRRGRFPKPVRIGIKSPITSFDPNQTKGLDPIILNTAELEAFRLVDFEGLSQYEAGQRMGVSRGTVWRLVQSARKKASQALIEGKKIEIHTFNEGENNKS